MKNFILLMCAAIISFSCKKAQIQPTQASSFPVPWIDSSNKHPKSAALTALLKKYHDKGLPGISLLVNDANGTWIGAIGKADIEKNIPFDVGQVSKVASITKLFIGTLVFKLTEDSANTDLGYNALNAKIATWLPSSFFHYQ